MIKKIKYQNRSLSLSADARALERYKFAYLGYINYFLTAAVPISLRVKCELHDKKAKVRVKRRPRVLFCRQTAYPLSMGLVLFRKLRKEPSCSIVKYMGICMGPMRKKSNK